MTAAVRVATRTDNVAGVKLPVFTQRDTGQEIKENLGLVSGGRKIASCREKFGDYVKALIKLASLQTSFVAMDEALKVTNRRVNALENVTIPKIVEVLSMINRELDELEREDFTRLKKVQSNKAVQIKIAEDARKAEKAASAAAGGGIIGGGGGGGGGGSSSPAASVAGTTALAGYDAADDDDVVFK